MSKAIERLAGKRLDAVLGEAKEAQRGKAGVTKRSTSLATKDHAGAGGDGSGGVTGVMRPSEEQLVKINGFTRSPKTADEVVVFNTLSANNLVDRDEDKFTDRTLRGFADAPAPVGSIGKSFMLSHNYETLPVGRIFDAGTKTVDGALYLTNEVYIPNTPQYQPLIESIDFGVNWAVSVGVMLEQVLCSVCNDQMWNFWGMSVCDSGHIKGESYDPNNTETDSWGFIEPADPKDKNAVKAIGLMDGAKDFYELSQVFLGAQYFAGQDSAKGARIKGVLDAAKAANIPVLGLSRKEADELPLPRLDERVERGIDEGVATTLADGTVRWTDSEGLMWCATPGEDVVCLGKAATAENLIDTNKEVDDNGEGHSSDPGVGGEVGEDHGVEAEQQRSSVGGEAGGEVAGERAAGEAGSGEERHLTAEDEDESDEPSDDDSEDEAESESSESEATADEAAAEDPDDDTPTKSPKETGVSKSVVLAAVKAAGLPAEFLAAAAEAEDNGLMAVLSAASAQLAAVTEQVEVMRPKAALGDTYIKSLRAEAIDAYVRAHASGNGGVSTDNFEKILTACGDNVDLIQVLTAEQQELAKTRWPSAVRRSTVDEDPNAQKELTELTERDPVTSQKASRLH